MTMSPKKAPYGSWKSPITADHVVNSPGRSPDELLVDSVTSERYHLVGRPAEGGRSALVHTESGKDVLPGKEWNVRTGVHEYGGAPAIVRDGTIYFSHRKDNRVYRFREGEEVPVAVTPEKPEYRYADFDAHPNYPHLLVSILEDHTNDTPSTVVNTLCIINTNTKAVSPLVSGADFYAQPRFTPDGAHILWQQWSFPDMSWEGAEIFVADVSVADGKTVSVTNTKHVAGEPRKISAYYPSWISNDTILFLSDMSGYYNPWTYSLATQQARPILREPIAEDFGGSAPAWQLGLTFYAVLPGSQHAVFTAMRDGRSVLYLVDLQSGEHTPLDNPYTIVEFMHWVSAEKKILFQGSIPDDNFKTVWLSVTPASPLSKSEYSFDVIPDKSDKPSALAGLPSGYVSMPQGLTLNAPNGDAVYAIYWPPANPDYQGLDGETPPCVVSLHGGPTSAAQPVCSLGRSYFTSRGFAWLDVQYGGSSGYGRAYRERLNGMWGVTDREDTLNVARAVAAKGLADLKRLVVRGGSSGGYVVLSAISFSSDPTLFAAANSWYGISDLTALASDTHKFESRYVDGLLANINENPEVFKERSPVQHVDKIVTPLLLLQGDEDRVVPKSQSDMIYESIKRRGGVVEYQVYLGEGHGFRKAEHVKDATERELAFYRRILNIGADDAE
ncbi:Alpha/Beta hydrolase protein [Schizophyllum commune]